MDGYQCRSECYIWYELEEVIGGIKSCMHLMSEALGELTVFVNKWLRWKDE
jgi:hypothetical protein